MYHVTLAPLHLLSERSPISLITLKHPFSQKIKGRDLCVSWIKWLNTQLCNVMLSFTLQPLVLEIPKSWSVCVSLIVHPYTSLSLYQHFICSSSLFCALISITGISANAYLFVPFLLVYLMLSPWLLFWPCLWFVSGDYTGSSPGAALMAANGYD